MKVLCMTPVPREGAGTRARILQYLPYLQAAGIEVEVRPFLFSEFFAIAYAPGRWVKKARYFLISSVRRLRDCLQANRYDAIYIYRECFPFGPPVCEWLLMRSRRPIIYDLDDAIHLPDPRVSLGRWIIERLLKWHSKVSWIIRRSTHVVVGNAYLQSYARRFNPSVTVLPTPEDPSRFNGRSLSSGEGVTIGWIGTHSTVRYLKQLTPVFQALATRYPFELRVIGDGSPLVMPGVRVTSRRWRLEDEAREVQAFDIGVYPLSGAEFDRGKACYKAILYMAAGVPVVASRFGANCDIIQDGVNGFLASSAEEWIRRLSQLAEQPDLRARLQDAGRRTVAARYSIAANAPRLIEVIRSAGAAARRKPAA